MRRILLFCFIMFFTVCLPGNVSTCAYASPESFEDSDLMPVGILYTGRQLASSAVKAVCQDRDGFIWIGTDYGLNRFDGYTFSLFRHQHSDPYSVGSNEICALLSDSQGRLWVGTNKDLSRYDMSTNRFVHVSFPKNISPRVSDLIETKNGDIYITTSGYGLFMIPKGSDRIVEATTINRLLRDHITGRLCVDRQGNLWLTGRDNAFYRIMMRKGRAVGVNRWILSQGDVFQFLIDRQGRVLLVMKNALLTYDSHRGRFVDAGYRITQQMLSVGLSCARESPSGFLYVGTERGLYRVRRDAPPEQVNFVSDRFDLSNVPVHALNFDRNGNLWVRCFRIGMLLLNDRPLPFHTWTFLGQHPAYDVALSSVTSADDGGMWCTAWGNGLFHFNRYGIVTQHIGDVPDANVVYHARDGHYWVACANGLYELNPLTGSLSLVLACNENKGVMCDDGLGTLFFSVMGKGVMSYDTRTKMSRLYRSTDKSPLGHLCNDWVSAMAVDRSQCLWIATTNGVSCLDLRTGSFHPFGWGTLLPGHVVNAVCVTSDDNIVIGTESGLYLYDRPSHRLSLFPGSEMLEDQKICGLQSDMWSDLWVSTPVGLWQYDHRARRFISYGTGYGQITGEYVGNLSFRSADGMIGFGFDGGVTVFYPQSVKKIQNRQGRVWLTGAVIDDLWQLPQNGEIDMYPRNHTLTLTFSLLDYRDAAGVIYEYRIKGGQWHANATGDNTIRFNSLGTGTYPIEVRAVYGGRLMSGVCAIKVVVHAPWYASVWAYIVYLLLLCLLGYYLWHLYWHRKQHQFDEAKMRFLINAMHDVRSPLTMIVNPLHNLLSTETDPSKRNLLQVIDRNAKRISQLVNQILDKRKLDKEAMQIHCQETSLIRLITGTCKLYEYEAQQRGIHFAFEHDHDVMVWIDRMNIDKVIGNLLSNAFKYTDDGGEIKIVLSSTDAKAVIQVMDNGIGVGDEENAKHLFDRFSQGVNNANLKIQGTGIGLDLCRSVVALHHGTIEASNRTDVAHGACFTVTLPLGKDHLKPEEIIEGKTEKEKVVMGASRPKSNVQVMLVDDDEELTHYVAMELGDEYHVSIAGNGREALKELLMMPARYDIVISDVSMPEMDGITLLERIKENPHLSALPVILLSSKNAVDDRVTGLRHGADAYLSKPFNMEELRLTIDNLINTLRRVRGKATTEPQIEKMIGQEEVKGNNEILMERIVNCIHEHLSDPEYNVETLADDIGLSRAQLHRKMKEITGIATGKFIRDMRMKEAVHLLDLGTINISQIAYRVGFNDQNHFSQVFKRYYGVSPKEYREGKEALP
jgi:ligand-binding sensor domain-containing protein/DNA-binding response OmpR family regulator/two-component sensor histidine kinase/cbb3-type cytochrome oxidase subunit 3